MTEKDYLDLKVSTEYLTRTYYFFYFIFSYFIISSILNALLKVPSLLSPFYKFIPTLLSTVNSPVPYESAYSNRYRALFAPQEKVSSSKPPSRGRSPLKV